MLQSNFARFSPSQKSRRHNRSCVNRSPVQYDFRDGAKTILCRSSVNKAL